MRQSVLIVFTLLSGWAIAQKTTPSPPPAASPDQCLIAFYTRDSIAIQFAEAKPKYESIQKSHDNLHAIREKQIPAMDRVLTTNSDAAKTEVSTLKKDSIAEEQNIVKQYSLLQPTYGKIDAIADSIGKARGVKQVREAADNSAMICPTDQMLMIDITNDVALAMGVKPKLAKIGIYNMDSLMRLMPGYSIIADSIVIERNRFEKILAGKDSVIQARQHELDSLRPALSRKQISLREGHIANLVDDRDTYRGWELYNLDMRDSVATKSYRDKFYRALAETHKQYGCVKSYEYARAHAEWKPEEAEFIDLNATIAKKLRP
jgi:hypothetical protein